MGRVNNTPKQLRVAQQRLRQRVISFLGEKAKNGFEREDLLGPNAPFSNVRQAGQFLAVERAKQRATVATNSNARMWTITEHGAARFNSAGGKDERSAAVTAPASTPGY